jgi:hypothetical protein
MRLPPQPPSDQSFRLLDKSLRLNGLLATAENHGASFDDLIDEAVRRKGFQGLAQRCAHPLNVVPELFRR